MDFRWKDDTDIYVQGRTTLLQSDQIVYGKWNGRTRTQVNNFRPSNTWHRNFHWRAFPSGAAGRDPWLLTYLSTVSWEQRSQIGPEVKHGPLPALLLGKDYHCSTSVDFHEKCVLETQRIYSNALTRKRPDILRRHQTTRTLLLRGGVIWMEKQVDIKKKKYLSSMIFRTEDKMAEIFIQWEMQSDVKYGKAIKISLHRKV